MNNEDQDIRRGEWALDEYANILNEARVRILGINSIVSGTSSEPPWFTAELGYLQLRMLCELVALGCLIAHGDIEETRGELSKRFEADWIMKRLEQLHADFYPHPIVAQIDSGLQIERIESGFLTKSDLVKLYHECGEHLHRGRLSRIYHPTKPKMPPQIERVIEWGEKFSVLLSQHHIARSSNREHLVCFISHHQANGGALVLVAKSLELESGAG